MEETRLGEVLGHTTNLFKWLIIGCVVTMICALFGFETIFSDAIKKKEVPVPVEVAQEIEETAEKTSWLLFWKD